MENRRHYCVRCAVEIREVTGITAADRRADAPRIR
jgi:ribosomal protein S26